MQRITLNFKQEPKIQDLVADKEMGAKILFVATLASKDEESVTVTVTGATDDPGEAEKLMAEDDGDASDQETPAEDSGEAKPVDGAPAPDGSMNTPGGSTMQDMMAADGPTT